MTYGTLLDYTLTKIDATLERAGGAFPHVTSGGRWSYNSDGYWTGGFWVGLLWFAYLLTGQQGYRQKALGLMDKIAGRKDRPDADFDLGFLFYPSFVLGYKITGHASLRTLALQAAERLTTMFHHKAGLIYHVYDERLAEYGGQFGSSIIDVMMNLSLLWWAYEQTGQERYFELADGHARRSLDTFIRDDGSTWHVVDFDLASGQILRRGTRQGYADTSCWSRGQAWAIHGYILAYKFSGDPLFREAYERLSDYFIRNLPEDGIPFWDFNDPNIPDTVRDSSAAAIACAGWQRLQGLGLDPEGLYTATVRRLWQSLEGGYLQPRDRDGILGHGCFYKARGLGVDEGTIWGDYYLLESLMDEPYKI
ncbi:MAG: glucuronyl hydrolase [Anaerolineae bacterium]